VQSFSKYNSINAYSWRFFSLVQYMAYIFKRPDGWDQDHRHTGHQPTAQLLQLFCALSHPPPTQKKEEQKKENAGDESW